LTAEEFWLQQTATNKYASTEYFVEGRLDVTLLPILMGCLVSRGKIFRDVSASVVTFMWAKKM